MIEISLNNDTGFETHDALDSVVRAILAEHGIRHADLSLAIVDDPSIHTLNRRHLSHDYPTDVLSFLLDRCGGELEGEVIVSCDTATRCAREYGWSPMEELLLYFVHGCLHLVGYDDHAEQDRQLMRQQEHKYLLMAGISAEKLRVERSVQESEAPSP